MQLMITSSHKTTSLDKGTKALQLLWSDVEDDIEDQFDEAEDLDDKIILIQVRPFFLPYIYYFYFIFLYYLLLSFSQFSFFEV